MFKYYIKFLIILLITTSCSNKDDITVSKNFEDVKNPEEIYVLAKNYFDNKNYDLSYEEFLELKKLYPLSNEAIQAEIMIGFINYLKMDYESAELQFQKFINSYPAHKNLDYIYYMIAMCNYEQITHHGLDGSFNELALINFEQVIKRFPESQYAKDSRQKIILVKSNQAAKHMEIGRYYLKQKKYTAALNRFKTVIDNYSMTKFTPEALHRMVEAYYEIGMLEESTRIASVLGHNYPDSKWYKYSYNLIKKVEDKDSFYKKVKNFF